MALQDKERETNLIVLGAFIWAPLWLTIGVASDTTLAIEATLVIAAAPFVYVLGGAAGAVWRETSAAERFCLVLGLLLLCTLGGWLSAAGPYPDY